MSAEPIPLHTPPRAELWKRNQLARSVLAHRPYTPETADLVARVLDGDLIDPSKEVQQ